MDSIDPSSDCTVCVVWSESKSFSEFQMFFFFCSWRLKGHYHGQYMTSSSQTVSCSYWPGYFSSHFQTTNFRLVQIERLCRRHFKILRKWQKVIQTGRKHCGKRRNCSSRAISPFSTVFSKGLFPRGVKRCHCVGMG